MEYDDRDRAIRSTVYGESGDARVTTTVISGRQTTITNPKNYTNVRVVDATGLLATATDANAQVTTYQHEPFGNLSQVTLEASHVEGGERHFDTCWWRAVLSWLVECGGGAQGGRGPERPVASAPADFR